MRHVTRKRSVIVRMATAYDSAEGETFSLPDDLTALDDEALAALEAEAVDHFDAIREGGDVSESALAAMEALADSVDVIRGEQTRREEARAEAAETVAALSARMNPEAAADGDETDEADASGDEATAEGETPEPTAEEQEQAAEEPEPVLASSRPGPVSLRGIRRATPRQSDPEPEETRASIIAAADVPGFSAGQRLSRLDLALAASKRFAAMGKGGSASKVPIGTIRTEYPENLTVRGNDAYEVTEFAASERNLPGGSLLAAGGFCSPREQFFTLCDGLESGEGLIDLPTVNLARGRASVFGGINIEDVYGQVDGFHFTQDDDERGAYDASQNDGGDPPVRDANTQKPCIRVPCLDPVDVEVEGHGLCIETGIFQQRFAPEQVDRFLDVALTAYAHKENAEVLAEMRDLATAVTMPTANGATAHVLGSIELMVQHMRHRYRTPQSATFEAVLPYWLRAVLRSDLAKRVGLDLLDVTDERLNAHLASRGIRPQWVYDWQDAAFGGTAQNGAQNLGSATTVPTAWPTQVDLLIYAAGSYVRYESADIDLSGTFDTSLMKANDVNLLFIEQMWSIANRCYTPYLVSIPLCPDGSTQGGVDLSCTAP